jgi:putative restriction endonuclease
VYIPIMEYWVGITDERWFNFLRALHPEDVNFWKPGSMGFRAIPQGAPFVFKLKGKINRIVGLGFFYQYLKLPITVAWDTFHIGNGFQYFSDFVLAIEKMRRDITDHNGDLGCITLTNPVFFEEHDWLEVPADFKTSTQIGKRYSTETEVGRSLWTQLEIRLQKYLTANVEQSKSLAVVTNNVSAEYKYLVSKVRIGQASFRVAVTEAYRRRCSITGERTLPVLEAAHIKSYAKSGPNLPSNGLLLRSDIHKLFDTGYLTVGRGLRVEVSSRIKTQFENGQEYYKLHGKLLVQLPGKEDIQPHPDFLSWHNENVYRG